MSMGRRIGSAVAIFLVGLAGCAGRDPQPVAVVQPGDSSLDCAAVQAEVLANNKTVQGLASEEGGKVVQNVAAGVVGLFIWPVWFAMDFKGSAGKEEDALQSRQQYLAVLAAQKNCGVAPPRTAIAAMPPPATPSSSPAAPIAAPIPAASAIAPAPAPITAPMTPCGEDRPCLAQ
jgi:hypothetical protein